MLLFAWAMCAVWTECFFSGGSVTLGVEAAGKYFLGVENVCCSDGSFYFQVEMLLLAWKLLLFGWKIFCVGWKLSFSDVTGCLLEGKIGGVS